MSIMYIELLYRTNLVRVMRHEFWPISSTSSSWDVTEHWRTFMRISSNCDRCEMGCVKKWGVEYSVPFSYWPLECLRERQEIIVQGQDWNPYPQMKWSAQTITHNIFLGTHSYITWEFGLFSTTFYIIWSYWMKTIANLPLLIQL